MGDDDCVFVMSREAAIGRAYGPAVAVERDAAGACGNDGLDGDDEALGEQMPSQGVGEVWDAGLFMNRAADAVAAKFADDAEAAAAHFALDCAADIFGAVARTGVVECLPERAFGAVSQLAGLLSSGRDLDGDDGIGVVAVFDGGEVKLDQVAWLDDAITRNAVNDFVVDADADVAGKVVDQRRR